MEFPDTLPKRSKLLIAAGNHLLILYIQSYYKKQILMKAPESELPNRHITLSVISGFYHALSWRHITDPMQQRFGRELVSKFSHEAHLDGNPTHICQALAMEASYFSRLADFEQALDAVKGLEGCYKFEEHSSGILRQYGHDFCAQTFSDSVLWYNIIGDKERAKEQIDFIIKNHLPKINPKSVDRIMQLLYPLLIAMKEMKMAGQAHELLIKFVSSRFTEYDCSLTHWKTLYAPTANLLEAARMEEIHHYNKEKLNEIEFWVLKEENTAFSPFMRTKGCLMVGEICWILAQRKRKKGKREKVKLIQLGSNLLSSISKEEQMDVFMVNHCELLLSKINAMRGKSQRTRSLMLRNALTSTKSVREIFNKKLMRSVTR